MLSRWIWTAAYLALVAATLEVHSASAQPAPAQTTPAPGNGKDLVAVLELDGVNTGKPELTALTEELRAQLLQTGKFRVVDRQQIDAILKEQAFQQTGCCVSVLQRRTARPLDLRSHAAVQWRRISDHGLRDRRHQGRSASMAEVKVYYDPVGHTLTVWFGDPKEEEVCEETGEEVILMKDRAGRVIGFEKLNFFPAESAGLRVAFETIAA